MKITNNIRVSTKGIGFANKEGETLSNSSAITKIFNRLCNYLADLELFFLHAISLHIPIYSIRKLAFLFAGINIGKDTKIHMGAKFFNPKGISIGDGTVIGDSALLDGRDTLTIGNHVDIASEVMIYNSEHDISSPSFEAISEPVQIGDYVFIGPRAIILPGVKIEKGAIVAAAAVVTSDVDELAIVGGVPAKKIGVRKLKNPSYNIGRTRLFQ